MLLLSDEVDFVIMYTVPDMPTPFLERAFETLTLAGDVLIPVCAPGLRDNLQSNRMPIISYPSDVFLGEVFDRHIASRLESGTQVLTQAETALTLAAYEFAVQGIGVAWLPRSLVVEALAKGTLTSLEGELPVQPLSIGAFRLSGKGGPEAEAKWRNTLSEIDLPDHLKPA
jgi:DNA-binding transcriptional LysR family regulator